MASLIEYTPPKWRNLEMRKLKVDEAYVVPKSEYEQPIYIYSLSEKCYTCPFAKVQVVDTDHSEEAFKLNITYPVSLKVFNKDVGRYAPDNIAAMCTLKTPMQEFGVYNLSVDSNGSCKMITDKAGLNTTLPLFSAIVLIILVLLIVKVCMKRFNPPKKEEESETPKNRFKDKQCLDTFRGMVIVFMIFVQSGGGGYWWVLPSPWNGFHVGDATFPSFLWIMGVCTPVVVKNLLLQGLSKKSVCKKIIMRTIKMFFIGFCINSIPGPPMEQLRIMGVLQRLGIASGGAGLVHAVFAKAEFVVPESGFKRTIFDLILLREQFLVMIPIVFISLGVVFLVNAPGCPRGYIGPGGMDSGGAYPDCGGGIVGYIDRTVLGEDHINAFPTAKYIYDTKPFDQEGLFGCVLSFFHGFIGVVCGTILIVHDDWKARIKRWIIWAIVLGICGGILAKFSEEGGWIPVNKNLWSFSYVLVACALDFFILTFLYYTIEIRHIWTGFPFTECGLNTITLYTGQMVFHEVLPWRWSIGAMNTHFILVIKCFWTTALWVAIGLYMDKKEFYFAL